MRLCVYSKNIFSNRDFNPRTHRGVRLSKEFTQITFTVFQSTHPSWGATFENLNSKINTHISIHAPIVGCDGTDGIDDYNELISIHAPIVGCDHKVNYTLIMAKKFQSTHPSWGATYCYLRDKQSIKISIHAPIVGCDVFQKSFFLLVLLFQSTHPSWGATICCVACFNALV